MRKLLLQLDSAPLPSVFDRVVAYDGGSDDVMSYGGVAEGAVRDLVHGAIFTRGTKDLHNTAIFIGGPDMAAGERILAAARAAFFGPFRVSVMLDPNGSNTTAVAAVMKLLEAVGGDVRGRRLVVVAGTGPVGMRAAGLLAKAGADVALTSRKPPEDETKLLETIRQRFGGNVRAVQMKDGSRAAEVLEGAELLLNAGPAGVELVPRDAWRGRPGLRVAIDLNAVPPLGINGVEVNDDGRQVDGVTAIGAIGVGNLKIKIHRECIARLFTRNDLVLDAEAIADVARELVGAAKG